MQRVPAATSMQKAINYQPCHLWHFLPRERQAASIPKQSASSNVPSDDLSLKSEDLCWNLKTNKTMKKNTREMSNTRINIISTREYYNKRLLLIKNL